ncbi:hypothetical protein SAY87_018857 [Trapa incisa]|uniref:DUF7026 domain-containing protein n=1 Tax=Trapa incisa TaxID=236973 RepID=A0AAN7K0L8_9MYRT|nr:hypothetical protein SAY87_018857 [Trapa incisa]
MYEGMAMEGGAGPCIQGLHPSKSNNMEDAAEVAKLNTQEAMRKRREALFTEICRSVGLEEDEMRKKWRMGEEERGSISSEVREEMLEEHVNEEEDRSFFFPGLKRWMGFPEDL